MGILVIKIQDFMRAPGCRKLDETMSYSFKNNKRKDPWNLETYLPPGKLTWHWKIHMFNRKYIFKWWIFHCHVSFWGGVPFSGGCLLTHDLWASSAGLNFFGSSVVAVAAKVPLLKSSVGDSTNRENRPYFLVTYIYIPRTQLTSIFEDHPPKTRPFPIKTRVIWVLGIYTCIYIYTQYRNERFSSIDPIIWNIQLTQSSKLLTSEILCKIMLIKVRVFANLWDENAKKMLKPLPSNICFGIFFCSGIP